jgi:nitroreductase
MITDLLRTRASVRWFQDRAIPGDVLRDMLEAGRLSPSGGDEQPWAFGVVTDRTVIARIAEIACQQRWIAHAPLLIVLCTRGVDDARGGRDIQRTRFPEYAQAISDMEQDLYWALNQEEHQTKIAGAHIALAAWEHGVGCCWVSRFEVKRLAALLNLPKEYLPSEILAFGYPERQPQPKPKKSMAEVVFHNRFEQGQADSSRGREEPE